MDIRLSILGAGNIARRMADTVNGLSGVTLRAVASRQLDKAQAFGKKYVGPEIHIEEEETSGSSGQSFAPGSTEERLRELRSLYDQRLITQEEYEQKRQEILKQL